MRAKQPELRITFHNPNTPENTAKLLARWYAEAALQIVHDPKNAGKTLDEIFERESSASA